MQIGNQRTVQHCKPLDYVVQKLRMYSLKDEANVSVLAPRHFHKKPKNVLELRSNPTEAASQKQ